MAVLDHDQRHLDGTSSAQARGEGIACLKFGLFWLGFFVLVFLANYAVSLLVQ